MMPSAGNVRNAPPSANSIDQFDLVIVQSWKSLVKVNLTPPALNLNGLIANTFMSLNFKL